MTHTERMPAQEMRASLSLASIYGLRMLGMFLILPIFSIYAESLPGGQNHILIGLALGAYGLTQAVFQLPFGMASDRYGRKRMIYLGLAVFAAGSLIAGMATSLYIIILGRAIQGAGAISAAITALVADLTSEEHRTKAMAIIGGTIGTSFAVSLILGPALNHWIGVPGIFMLTAILAVLALLVVKFVVPDPQVSSFHSDGRHHENERHHHNGQIDFPVAAFVDAAGLLDGKRHHNEHGHLRRMQGKYAEVEASQLAIGQHFSQPAGRGLRI